MNTYDIIVTRRGAFFMNRRFACSVGRGGVTDEKVEGDGATPRGVHRITGVLFRPDRGPKPLRDAVPIRAMDVWSDDPADPLYNRKTRMPHHFSHEKLSMPLPLYDIVILTDWNWPNARPGRGSAIFIHQWRRRKFPTAGCVGLSRKDLRRIVSRLRPHSRLIIR